MSIRIIEVFIRIREVLISQKDILIKLEKLEKEVEDHDNNIILTFEYLRQLEQSRQQQKEQSNRKRIGFRPDD